MALAWTPIDNQASSSGSSRVNTVPAGGVPLGALLVALVTEISNSAPGAGSIADAGGNAYTYNLGASANNVQSNGFTAIYTALVSAALTSGQLVTYTKAIPASNTRLVTGYVTGQDSATPVDASASTSAFGSSAGVTVTSGTPAQASPFYIGSAFGPGGGTSTQAASWNTIGLNSVAPTAISAWIQGSGTTPQTYNSTWSSSRVWAACILVVNPPITGGGGGGTINVPTMPLLGVVTSLDDHRKKRAPRRWYQTEETAKTRRVV